MNVETWRRLARINLLDLVKELSAAAMETLQSWPSNGDGRKLKEACEMAVRDLHGSNSVRLAAGARDIEIATIRLVEASSTPYFAEFIAPRKVKSTKWKGALLGDVVSKVLGDIQTVLVTQDFSEDSRIQEPPKIAMVRPARRMPPTLVNLQFPRPARDQVVAAVIQPQNVEAIQFGLIDGQLRVHDLPTATDGEFVEALESMRFRLLKDAKWLADHLEGSNVDRRTTSIFSDLAEDLSGSQNIVQIGIGSITLGEISKRYIDEIAEPISARWRAFATSLSIYVGHFDTWRELVGKSTEIEWDTADADQTRAAATELVTELTEYKGLTDPKVPRSIELLLEAASLPGKAGKRGLYSLIRTLENFVSYATTIARKLSDAALEGTATAVKRTAATAATVALLGVAGNLALQASPSARNILKSDWVANAEAINKALKGIAD